MSLLGEKFLYYQQARDIPCEAQMRLRLYNHDLLENVGHSTVNIQHKVHCFADCSADQLPRVYGEVHC